METKKIEDILLEEPYKVKVEGLNEIDENSFMLPVYEKAAKIVNEIIDHNRSNSEHKENGVDSGYKSNVDYNNIIAFTGDRGAGKTSAMLSFDRILIEKNKENDKKNLGDEIKKLMKSESIFAQLSLIEPSNFIKG